MLKNKFVLILLLATIVYGWNFWGTPIYILDESKNAGCAAEMMQRGDLIVPMFNNEFHDKSAVQYYFMMTAYSVFGVNSFSARLFSVVFGVLTVAVTFWFGRRLINEQVALYASLMLISSLQMAYMFQMAVPDPYLIFFVTLALFSFYTGYIEQRTGFLYLFYFCIGMGFVSKGPIALALPGLIVLIFLIWRRDFSWRRLMELRLIPGGLLTLAVGLPWYVAVGIRTHWEWPEYFFITHNLSRYVTTFEGHRGFPFDTLVIVFAALLPTSIFVPQMAQLVWRHKKGQPILLFALVVCMTLIGFFLFSKTVLPSYPAPCIPFAALLLAWFLDCAISQGTLAGKLWINGIVFLIIGLCFPVAAYIGIHMDPELNDLTYLSSFFVVIPIGAAIGLFYLRKRSIDQAFFTYVGSYCITLILVFTFVMPTAFGRNPVSRSISMIREYNRPVAYFEWINSAYVFQYGQPIPRLATEKDLEEFVSKHGKVVVISSKKAWQNAHNDSFKVVFECKDLFETPTSIVLIN